MDEKKNEIAKQGTTTIQQFDFFNSDHFAVMQRVCKMFSSSELVPKMYQAKESGVEKATANCMIAIETAQRIGASPLMVMQNMYIVHGQPAWSAKFLTATVNGCGRYNSIRYKWENLGKVGKVSYTEYEWKNNKRVPVTKEFNGDALDNWQCIAFTTEKGNEDVLESIPVTIKMAIQEGWYQKAGSKWQTMAKLMLQYRTVTFWTRTYAPELSMGMKTEDEVVDIIDVPYEEIKDTTKPEQKTEAEIKDEIKDKSNASGEISMDDKKPEEKKKPEQQTIVQPKF